MGSTRQPSAPRMSPVDRSSGPVAVADTCSTGIAAVLLVDLMWAQTSSPLMSGRFTLKKDHIEPDSGEKVDCFCSRCRFVDRVTGSTERIGKHESGAFRVVNDENALSGVGRGHKVPWVAKTDRMVARSDSLVRSDLFRIVKVGLRRLQGGVVDRDRGDNSDRDLPRSSFLLASASTCCRPHPAFSDRGGPGPV